MDLDDRAFYIIVGMAIGAVLGYFTRILQEIRQDVVVLNNDVHEIKEEVDEIDTIVKLGHERDERGEAQPSLIYRLVLVSVIAMAVWASFTTNATNNKLENALTEIQNNQAADDQQEIRIQKVTSCTLEFTSKTIQALNERTKYAGKATDANARVLQAQQDFLEIILKIPPPSDQEALAALRTYTNAVGNYNVIADKNKKKRLRYAYPTNEELEACLGIKLPEVQGN